MQPVLLIPLVVFGLLAALFALVLRRAGQMLSRTRDAETFRRSMVELGRKIYDEIVARLPAELDATAPEVTVC